MCCVALLRVIGCGTSQLHPYLTCLLILLLVSPLIALLASLLTSLLALQLTSLMPSLLISLMISLPTSLLLSLLSLGSRSLERSLSSALVLGIWLNQQR